MAEPLSDACRACLRWSLIDGVGPMTFARLLVEFGDAEKALGASVTALTQISGISAEKAATIARQRDTLSIEHEVDAARELGVRLLCRADAAYPAGLRQIPDAPIVLYVKGELLPTDAIAIAVVGSRRCTIYGSEQARRFGELLAGAGFTIISGLARGIDAFAHHGAVDAGGRSIAVLGSGLHEIYPPENQALAEKLLSSGAWVSELPMRTVVRAGNFPSRNRIIAGMTLGTVVIEAAARSGALITARLASEYNREVFAVPGRVQDPMSQGTNALIRSGGAKLIASLDDILDELGDVGRIMEPDPARDPLASPLRRAAAPSPQPGELGASAARRGDVPAPAALSPAEQRVLDLIGGDPLIPDAILAAVELPPGEALAALTTLELKGLIRRLPGQRIIRRTPA